MRNLGLLVIVLTLCLACGKKPRVVSSGDPSSRIQEGLASWYGKGDGYHGKRTASGEKFDQNQLTAAHFSLPFNTLVQVTNQRNGKKVQVRINDRFPVETLRKGRIIDLSYRAAQLLEMIEIGVVPVRLEVLDP